MRQVRFTLLSDDFSELIQLFLVHLPLSQLGHTRLQLVEPLPQFADAPESLHRLRVTLRRRIVPRLRRGGRQGVAVCGSDQVNRS